jgi:hypothetical protein
LHRRKTYKNLWKTQRSLESAQRELITLLYSLDDKKNIAAAKTVLEHISQSADNAIGDPITETANDRDQADRDFKLSVLYQRLQELNVSEEEPQAFIIADDAPDVIAVSRRRR